MFVIFFTLIWGRRTGINFSLPALCPPGGRFASPEHQPNQPSLSVGHCDLEWHCFVDRQLWKKEWQWPTLRTPQRVHNLQVRTPTAVATAQMSLFKWWPARPMLGLLYVPVFQLLTISRAATNILHIQRPWVETKYPPTPNNITITTTTTTNNNKKKKNQNTKWSDLRGKMKLNFSTMKM